MRWLNGASSVYRAMGHKVGPTMLLAAAHKRNLRNEATHADRQCSSEVPMPSSSPAMLSRQYLLARAKEAQHLGIALDPRATDRNADISVHAEAERAIAQAWLDKSAWTGYSDPRTTVPRIRQE